MGPYVYDIPGNPYVPDNCKFTPIKAQGAEVYLVERMKATEAPNYFITTDFKKFKPLSDVQPQNRYNWLTSELVSWKGLDGRRLQGILYKPENFDSTKKYPVIVHYYEKKTDGLNAFLEPDFLSGNLNINIPWYVSNGYLVFLPDIHYKIGETGESVINSVLPSVQYLCRMNWVNSKKIGIQGGSFGGYETNYLITHTTIFAAACSASGLSNLVSSYGALVRGSTSKQIEFECTQFRLGVNLWQRSDVYIKNSPIFFANRVETPLLIMHTTQDGTCPFADAAAFFTALRRLGKKAWMLQYNDGDHGVYGKSAIDFSTRMIQFFDHYLKDKPAVEWMTGGEFTAKKGVETGCVLDSALGLKEK
jgi:dipeptidyl aminopeptidase/acylaminoacyl peptidase